MITPTIKTTGTREKNIATTFFDTLGNRACAILRLADAFAFGSPTLQGILGDGKQGEQKENAFAWMEENYERFSAVIYAIWKIAEELFEDIEAIEIVETPDESL